MVTYLPPGLTELNFTFCPKSVVLGLVWISENKTAIIFLSTID
jgi:hypothetical protein